MLRLLGLLVLPLALASCGDDFATLEPENPTTAAEGLVFTRADGSSYELQDAVAVCVAADQKPGLQVLRLTAPADLARGSDNRASFRVEVVPGTIGTFPLPLKERDAGAGPPDVAVTSRDPRHHDELSGSAGHAAGHITIREATCDPEPRMALTIDATVASETTPPRLRVRGGMASSGG